jgi:DNA phosphorothioation-dependent restriction protein DptH
MLTETERDVLRDAFNALLGAAQPGAMAFVRCLPEDAVLALAADPAFRLDGWQIAAVTSEPDPQARRITAGQAVEWREAKSDPTLLLVDPQDSGPGMDGIYSASREIGESELFRQAVELARQRLPHRRKRFALEALRKAGWQKRRRPLAPWAALRYLCLACDDDAALGGALTNIGFWPVAVGDNPDHADLEHSGLLVERLLPVHGTRILPEQRVESLSLDAGQREGAQHLVQTLSRMEGAQRSEVLEAIGGEPGLWLNRLRPGIFDRSRLQSISIRSWRQQNGKLYRWSGLSMATDGGLELRLPIAADGEVGSAKLDVRWTVEPEMLTPGAATYQVVVHAGGDVLAERTLEHKGRREQKVIFSQDDFDELDEHARFQAQVRVSAVGDDCEPAESEVFVLCFGEPAAGKTAGSAGKTAPSLALAAAQVADDWESFKLLGKNPQDPSLFQTDDKGFVLCKQNDRVAKVFSPPLFRDLCNDWTERDGAVGRWRLRVREDGKPVGSPEFVPLNDVDTSGQLAQASADLAAWLRPTQGPLGVLYLVDELKPIDRYVSAAGKLWAQSDPVATLIQTLEVQSLAGDCLGLIVLPTHPLRIAWQQGFDLMVAYHRYRTDNADKLTVKRLTELLQPINGAHYPAFLPGWSPAARSSSATPWGCTRWPWSPTMIRSRRQPWRCSGGCSTATRRPRPRSVSGRPRRLSSELTRYLLLHPDYRRIRVHALRAGDAMPVARALGRSQRALADG